MSTVHPSCLTLLSFHWCQPCASTSISEEKSQGSTAATRITQEHVNLTQYFLWVLLNRRSYVHVQHLQFYSFDTGWLTNIKRNLPVKIRICKSIKLQRNRKQNEKHVFPPYGPSEPSVTAVSGFPKCQTWLGGPELFSDWGESREAWQIVLQGRLLWSGSLFALPRHPVALARSSGAGLSSWGSSPLLIP